MKPGAIGFLLASTFDRMLTVAVGASVVSCIAGVFASYHLDAATAPLIVVFEAVLFSAALLTAKLSGRRRQRRHSLQQPKSLAAGLGAVSANAKSLNG